MREMVEHIVKQIVDSPAEVQVWEIERDKVILVGISVAKEDRDDLIGEAGRIASAIRTVVEAAAAKLKKRVTVEILDEERSDMEDKQSA